MQIDFNQKLMNYDGEELKSVKVEGGEKEVLTLSWACCEALMHDNREDKATPEQKLGRFELAQRICKSTKGEKKESVELSPEELVDLRKVLGQRFGTLIIGSSYPLLDGDKGGKSEK